MRKVIWILIVCCSSVFILSCSKKDKKGDNNSSGSLNMENLLTEEMIRRTFDVHDTTTIEQDLGGSLDNYIAYKWEEKQGNKIHSHTVALNFAKGEPLSESKLDAMWDSQNEGIYAEKDMEMISGVGRKASWAIIGKAVFNQQQLRVMTDKYIFYLTLYAGESPGWKEIWSKDFTIEKSSSLAKEIIPKL